MTNRFTKLVNNASSQGTWQQKLATWCHTNLEPAGQYLKKRLVEISANGVQIHSSHNTADFFVLFFFSLKLS